MYRDRDRIAISHGPGRCMDHRACICTIQRLVVLRRTNEKLIAQIKRLEARMRLAMNIRLRNSDQQAIVDPEDYVKIYKDNWRLDKRCGVPVHSSIRPALRLDRFILKLKDPHQWVVHRNGNKLDCRKANLEVVRRGTR